MYKYRFVLFLFLNYVLLTTNTGNCDQPFPNYSHVFYCILLEINNLFITRMVSINFYYYYYEKKNKEPTNIATFFLSIYLSQLFYYEIIRDGGS